MISTQRLSELKEGQKAIITKIYGKGAFKRRLLEMGFIPGKEIEVIKFAPLKDPIEYKIMNSLISLRRSEADLIEVVTSIFFNFSDEQYFNYQTVLSEIKQYAKEKTHTINVALVGNPNSGKTTLFNSLTGSYEHVGNYVGVTVDAKTGKTKYKNYTINFTDLPGTYSLSAYSPEEIFVRKHIIEQAPDIVINVIETPNLERSLFLTTQLIDMDIKMILVLNMFDEFEQNENKINLSYFSELIGIPVVTTVASKKIGIDNLFDKIIETHLNLEPNIRHIHINYGKEIENCITEIQQKIKHPFNKWLNNTISSRFLAIKLLESDKEAISLVNKCYNSKEILDTSYLMQNKLNTYLKEDVEILLNKARYGFINGLLRETVEYSSKDRFYKTNKIDNVLTHKILGIPIFLAFIYLAFFGTFMLGEYPTLALEWFFNKLNEIIKSYLSPGMLTDLITDGIISGVGNVAIFFPNIILLYTFISIMEDTGYMSRAAFIMDKFFHKIGLHGKSFIPLIMGFGCNVPAIMATRTIENKSDRLITILINPFMSCSARLPIYLTIISAIFPKYRALMLFFIYIFGIITAMFVAFFFRKTLFKKKEAPFVMELPPYRIPTFKATLKHVWNKSKSYLKKISTVIVVASIVIWGLSNLPINKKLEEEFKAKKQKIYTEFTQKFKNQKDAKILTTRDSLINEIEKEHQKEKRYRSALGYIGRFFAPLMQPLGFDWRITIALISATPAKEIAISTMAILMNSDEENLANTIKNATYDSGKLKGRKIFTIPVALAFLIFTLLYIPCIATIATIYQETQSKKWTLFAVFYSLVLAYMISFVVKTISSKIFL